jgi:hypothetical protein
MTTISKAAYRHLLDADASPEEVVIAYHERTKHYFHRYAASLGCMDWATQPDPFRRYPGADLVRLLLPKPVYHFTVGGQVDDTRLTTLPAYDFEEAQEASVRASQV